LPQSVNAADVLQYLEQQHLGHGEYLIRQGDAPDDVFFIASGQVTAQIERPGHAPVRLETMRGGHVVGELGFYLDSKRNAAVVADEPSTVYRLTSRALQRMEQEAPELASTFHQIIVHLLAERVVHLSNTVDALHRS
jgi:CRP-like cAMP-binding protein